MKDQHGKVAIFEEMTSNPATMEAAKIIDFFGCLDGKAPLDDPEDMPEGEGGSAEAPNHSHKANAPADRGTTRAPGVTTTPGEGERYVITQSDATQAYCQADLGGSTTWIRLPENRRPKKWAGMKDPVCKLVKALYGHPNSGCY